MKTRLPLLFAAILVLTASCAVSNTMHIQIMDRDVLNQSKYGILSTYGNPTTIRTIMDDEVWIYNMVQSGSKGRIKPANDTPVTSDPSGKIYFSSVYDRYIAITFHSGRVVRWETKGVNFGAKTGGSGGSGMATLILLYAILMAAALSMLITVRPSYY